MSAYNPPYVRRTASPATGGVVPPTETTEYYEPVMTTDGDYMIMGDGDIVMALVPIATVKHNEDFTVFETPPGVVEDFFESSETEPLAAPEGFRWYVPSEGVLYTRILDGITLVWVEL